jgi:divinyl protochlorophyllide a 8-vinyl-reductase
MSAALQIARIGPNAITQMTCALEQLLGAQPARALLRGQGFGAYLDSPPQGMVGELEVISLHTAVRDSLPGRDFHRVAGAAGRSTADYLLAHRIPAWLQPVLRACPARLSSRLLLGAIARHAWTFAGSGRFRAIPGTPVQITIEGCAMCCGAHAGQPMCDYYAETFGRLFAALVHPEARARETHCIAAGSSSCRFVVEWPASKAEWSRGRRGGGV